MKILLTGGGTGGHFYPIIAIAEAIYELAEEQRLLNPELVLAADKKYDKDLIDHEGMTFRKVYAGKMRRYFSLFNISDFFKTIVGVIKATAMVYKELPDVVFGKGGYASFPVLFAAKILRIPIIIHESDSVPGKINKWAAKFAKRIAISFEETTKHFPEQKTALTGTPVRKSIISYSPEEGREVFEIDPKIKTILILGGSQGALKINDTILDSIEELLKFSQIIHQTGDKNLKEVTGRAEVILENSIFKKKYHAYPYLNDADLRNASGVADLIISRAGGSAIYEIALWGKPSILIPIKDSAQDHQRKNAYNYARTSGALIIEEDNLTPHVLTSEIKRILENKEQSEKMSEGAKKFAKPEAARKIAQEIINLALEHS